MTINRERSKDRKQEGIEDVRFGKSNLGNNNNKKNFYVIIHPFCLQYFIHLNASYD